nr:hypothetical protein [uncultured Draconibacterium sp.]
MKQLSRFKGIAQVLLVFAIGLIVSTALGMIAGAAGMVLGDGTIVAGEALGTENAEDAQPGLHLDDIDEVVTKMWPAYAPLDQLMRTGIKGQRRATDSLKVRHYSVETKPFDDIVKKAVVAANQSALDLSVGNPALYGVGDTVFIKDVPGFAEGRGDLPLANANLELYVYAMDSANSILKCIPVNGDNSTPKKSLLKAGVQDIPLDAEIAIGGRALNEYNVQTEPSEYVPSDDYNYCQYFGSQIEISKWEKKHRKEVKFDEADQLELMLYDYRVRKEISYWFGSRNIIYPNGKETRTAGGITYFVDNEIDWSALLDQGKPVIKPGHIDEMVRQVFSGNAGTGQRWMFIGEYLWNALKRTDDIQRNLSANAVEYKYGLYFNKINTGDGELVLVKHPLFKFMGYGYNAVIIDANNIGERHFEAQSVQNIDKEKLAQSKSDAKFVSETSCPVIKYPKTHAIIKGPVYQNLV